MRIAAIICVRNEEYHIRRCLDAFARDGIDVILIDNDSEDKTLDIARDYLGHGLLSIKRQPWHGVYALPEILALKKAIIDEIDHDWVIHADADEWLCPPAPERSLAAAIRQVDSEGFNCLNFEEMVFVPWPGQDFTKADYVREMKDYYFFEPSSLRLMRAWRRDANANNVDTGGHKLHAASLKLYPTPFILRHYIALSTEHAVAKYVGRPFAPHALAKGWHVNRASLKAADVALRPSQYMKQLTHWDSQDFDRSTPARAHFWQWLKPQT